MAGLGNPVKQMPAKCYTAAQFATRADTCVSKPALACRGPAAKKYVECIASYRYGGTCCAAAAGNDAGVRRRSPDARISSCSYVSLSRFHSGSVQPAAGWKKLPLCETACGDS